MSSDKNYYLNKKHDSAASRFMEVIISLYFALTGLHLEYCIQLWGLQNKRDMELLEQIRGRS